MNALQHLKDTIRDTIATRPEMTTGQITELQAAVKSVETGMISLKKTLTTITG